MKEEIIEHKIKSSENVKEANDNTLTSPNFEGGYTKSRLEELDKKDNQHWFSQLVFAQAAFLVNIKSL